LNVADLRGQFAERGYVVDEDFATSLELMLALERPLLIEGPRIRLTEGDESSALAREAEIFSEAFLLKRPLLEAITQEIAPVLLIDEIDRADEAFEAFLLELLGEFQVSIPELGTVRARSRPAVIVTSNRSRELSDALRRRCLYHWIAYPAREREVKILRARLPGIDEKLAEQIAGFMEFLRAQPFEKVPGVAESLDWALALVRLHKAALDERTLELTHGCILKVQHDWELLQAQRLRYVPLLTGTSVAEPTTLEPDYGIGSVKARRG